MSPDSGLAGQPSSSTAVGQNITLHIGVLEQPYRSNSKTAVSISTGDVASILEAKYGLFTAFYKMYEQRIADGLATSMQGAIEAMMMGHSIDPWGAGMQQIQRDFRDFISSRQAERAGITGTPTKAALRGVNHRLAHPYRKSNPRRPSFLDTGLLMSSGRAWITVG
jgi:hypothetical protein